MRSLVYAGPRRLEWRETAAPALQADHEALVRPIASAACDLDRRIIAGTTPFQAPFAIGHEAVGEVLALGDDAGDLALGDRVVIPWHLSCGSCRQCAAGRPANCERTPPLAGYGMPLGGHHGGLFDDVVRVPYAAHALHRVPDGLDPAVAASCSDQLADAYGAVAPTLRRQPGATVLVIGGLASLGLWAVMFAAALGAEQVVYADTDADATRLAQGLGATRVHAGELPDRVDGDFALAVDCGGDPERSLPCALRSVAPGGHVVGRCVYFAGAPLPYWDVFRTGVTFTTGLPHATPHIPEVLALLRTGRADPRAVLAGSLPFDDAPDALLDPPRKAVFTRPPA